MMMMMMMTVMMMDDEVVVVVVGLDDGVGLGGSVQNHQSCVFHVGVFGRNPVEEGSHHGR